MDNVEELYMNGKLLVRAMDLPQLKRGQDGLEYDCSTWANEFSMMQNGGLSSASSTLLVPTVGVSTYKNIGFMINSDLADCFHISKTDSGSNGNVENGDFFAKEADFSTIDELANYIYNSKDTTMNEVNINTTLESVEGLFFNECPRQDLLLQMVYVVRSCLKSMTGIDYPIYSYDTVNGKINHIELTEELEQQITESLRTNKVFYWPDDYEQPVIDEIKSSNDYTR